MILETKSGPYDLTDDLIAGLQLRYPAVNVRDECLKLAVWLVKNKSRRPANVIRFVENNLKRVKLRPIPIAKPIAEMTTFEVERLARCKGIAPRPGESYEQLARRVREA